MGKLRIYIADDHTMFRRAMANLIRGFADVHEVCEAENGKVLINMIRNNEPDIAVIDMEMPVMDGFKTCEIIVKKFPFVKMIVLSMYDSQGCISEMFKIGVHAFLLKNEEPGELEKAIHLISQGKVYRNERTEIALRQGPNKGRGVLTDFSIRKVELTKREYAIIELLCEEYTIKQIGAKLLLSENTIRNHKVRIMRRARIKNTPGLVKFALQNGFFVGKRNE